MGTWSYAHDAAGNPSAGSGQALTRQTDARNQTICFFYDELNRLKGKTYRSDTNCPTTDPGYSGYTVKYYYDQTDHGSGVGRRTRMVDGSGSTDWIHDDRGRVTEETQVINGTSGGTFKTRWAYDALDRVVTMTYPGGNAGQLGEPVTFSLHSLRLSKLSQPQQRPLHQLLRMRHRGGFDLFRGEAGAGRYLARKCLVDHVRRDVGVSVDDKFGANGTGHLGDMPVGQTVALAGSDFQVDFVLGGQTSFLFGDETRVYQNVHVLAFNGRAVAAGRRRFDRCFPVDVDDGGPQPACSPGQAGNRLRWAMRQLHPGDECQWEEARLLLGETEKLV